MGHELQRHHQEPTRHEAGPFAESDRPVPAKAHVLPHGANVPHPRRRNDVRSFRGRALPGGTILEVVVAIACVAVVALLLLPALTYAAAENKRNICLNNIKQIGAAVQAFTKDHDGILPTVGSHPWEWGNANFRYLGSRYANAESLWHNGYLPDLSMLKCPSLDPRWHAADKPLGLYTEDEMRGNTLSYQDMVVSPKKAPPSGSERVPYWLYGMSMVIRPEWPDPPAPRLYKVRLEGYENPKQVLVQDAVMQGEPADGFPNVDQSNHLSGQLDDEGMLVMRAVGGNASRVDGSAGWVDLPEQPVIAPDKSGFGEMDNDWIATGLAAGGGGHAVDENSRLMVPDSSTLLASAYGVRGDWRVFFESTIDEDGKEAPDWQKPAIGRAVEIPLD